MTHETTIFAARKIVTMNPSNPQGTHVAVREGKVLGVGSLDELTGWGAYTLDETFKDHVLTAGMIEVHSHSGEGLSGQFPYQGYFDRQAPDGRTLKGIKTVDALLADLRAIDAEMTDPDAPLLTIGFDPIYFPGARLSKIELDTVSATRPIFLFHTSGHMATVNTAMLNRHKIAAETKTTGVARDAGGQPNGELQEMPAMMLAESAFMQLLHAVGAQETIWGFGRMARQKGITCVSDLAGTVLVNEPSLATWKSVVNDPAFPARVTIYNTPGMIGVAGDWGAAVQAIKKLQTDDSSDKLRFPGVKFVMDGSIQGYTCTLAWPGYYHGPNDLGQLLVIPEQFADWLRPFHQAGLNIHLHVNADTSIDLALDAIGALLKETPWLDHRHTLQHAQLTTLAHLRKMKNLGLCANFFVNHIAYFGDIHYEITLGPERANRMEPCGSAKRVGVPFSMHSDANVTPLGPLNLIWAAVNRVTPKGRVLGEHEKISAYDALWAVTQDAAYQMHMDHEIGSIETGKWADFSVLEESPLDVDPMKIKDINVWGTVVGGVKYEAARALSPA